MVLYYVIASIAFIVGVSSNIATICDEEPLYTFLPDVRDCNAWYFCSLNGTIRGTCSNQYLFNPKTRLCDWPRNVDCFHCTSNVGMHKISIEGSCRKFIRCIGGIATQNVCADGLQFNEFTGQCDLKSLVQCESGFRCPVKLPNNGSVIAIRDNRNCSVYYICIGDTEPIRQECNPELHFDPGTSLCTYPKYTDCPINENVGDPRDGPGDVLEPETEATVQSIPTDTALPSMEQATQSPTGVSLHLSDEPSHDLSDKPSHDLSDEPSSDLSDEPSSDLSDEPSSDLSDEPSSDLSDEPSSDLSDEPSSDLSDEPSSELSDESSSDLSDEPSSDVSDEPSYDPLTKTHEKPFECPFDGIHVHQIECSEYYICANNIAHHMKCAEGLHFNVVNLQCDFPENANCDFYNTI